ncbi:MAG TPA: hypothetical protein VF188_05180 [Longimicrobiales bacterium]
MRPVHTVALYFLPPAVCIGGALLGAHESGHAAYIRPPSVDRVVLPSISMPREVPADTGMTAGAVSARTLAEIKRAARSLGERFGQPAVQIEERLRQLRALPGAGIYVHMTQREFPSRVVIGWREGGSVSLPFTSGARLSVIMPRDPRAQEEMVVIFRIERGKQAQYAVQAPASVQHITIVENGREIVRARPIRPQGETIVFPLTAM